MKKSKLVSVVLLCILVLVQTSCWDQKIYERIGFILQLGLELDNEGSMIYTVSVPIVSPDIEGKVEILSTTADLLRESREKVRRVSGKIVEGGKTQHIYFSKELAEKGIGGLLEIFIRHTENQLLANIIVVDGSPKEMMELSAKFTDKPRPTFYVNDLLVSARLSSYAPETRIYDFLIMEFSKTIDPTAPLFRYDKKEIEVIGSALFSGDKLVGELNTEATGLLNTLAGVGRKLQYTYKDKKEAQRIKNGASILIKGAKRHIDLYFDEDIPCIEIKLDLIASLEECSQKIDFSNTEEKRKFEDEIALAIKKDCLELLEYLKALGSDPIGFGEIVRSRHNDYWRSMEWKEMYKEALFDVEVNLVLEFYGAIN